MVIYQKPRFIEVTYKPDKNYILFDWTDFGVTLEEIKELHQKALAVAVQKNCYAYLADTSEVKTALSPAVIEWWAKTWVRRLVQGKLQAIVTVVPIGAVAQMSTRAWQSEIVEGITMCNVKSRLEAEAVIDQLPKGWAGFS